MRGIKEGNTLEEGEKKYYQEENVSLIVLLNHVSSSLSAKQVLGCLVQKGEETRTLFYYLFFLWLDSVICLCSKVLLKSLPMWFLWMVD